MFPSLTEGCQDALTDLKLATKLSNWSWPPRPLRNPAEGADSSWMECLILFKCYADNAVWTSRCVPRRLDRRVIFLPQLWSADASLNHRERRKHGLNVRHSHMTLNITSINTNLYRVRGSVQSCHLCCEWKFSLLIFGKVSKVPCCLTWVMIQEQSFLFRRCLISSHID